MNTPRTEPKPEPSIAALIDQYGGAEHVRLGEVTIGLPGPEQIRVRVAAAGVNPFDINLRQGYAQEFVPLTFPACLGSDVSGVVDAVGEGVSEFAPGDRVMGFVVTGAYAQFVVAAVGQFTHVPDGIDLVRAAALPTGVLTGVQLVERGLKPQAGEKILVTGASGSVGRAAVFAALDTGAIVYAGVRASGREVVADLPVAGVIDLSDSAGLKAVGPFDYVADTVGGGVAQGLFEFLASDGQFASVAMPFVTPPTNASERFTPVIVEFDGPRLQRFTQDLIEKEREVPIAHRLQLADVAKAHGLLERGGLGGKIVLIPNADASSENP